MKKFKILSSDMRSKVAAEVKMMLHASRDCMRNQGKDTLNVSYNINDGYYGEAFGVMRGLSVLEYGDIRGPLNKNDPHNLRFWFAELEREVLEEENFQGNHECDYCLERFCKDDVRRKSW